MNGIHGLRFLRWKIEFFQYQLICLRIFLDPFPDSNFEGSVIHVIEYPTTGLVLIGSDKWTLSPMLITLFVKLLFPDILLHLGTGNPSV